MIQRCCWYDPTLLLAWPTSRVAVMGAEQAAGVLGIIQEEAARRKGEEPDLQQIEQMKFMVRANEIHGAI